MKINRKSARHINNPPLLSSVDISSTFEDDFLTSPVYTPRTSPQEDLVNYHEHSINVPQLQDHVDSEKVVTAFETYNSVPYSSPVTCVSNTADRSATDTWGYNDCDNDIEDLRFKTQFLDDDKTLGFSSTVLEKGDDVVRGRRLTEPVHQPCVMKDMKQCKSMSSIHRRHSRTSPEISCKSQPPRGWVFNALSVRNLTKYKTKTKQPPPAPTENEEDYNRNQVEQDNSIMLKSTPDYEHHQLAESSKDNIEYKMNNNQKRMDTRISRNDNEGKGYSLTHKQGKDIGSAEEPNWIQNSSQALGAKSLLGRLSQHRSVSNRSKNGKGVKEGHVTEKLEPSSMHRGRHKSSFLFKVWKSLLDRAPNGEVKAGVFDFDCDPQTALQEMKTSLERDHLGVNVSDQFSDVRMKVPLRVAGKHSFVNVSVVVEPLSEGKSRVCLRRGLPNMLTVCHEDFDWFCFQVFRTLVKTRQVVRPFV